MIPDFVIQAGGLRFEDGEYVDADPPRDSIPNESDNGLSNLRGTVAVALRPGEPDSGTRQFYVNLSDDNVGLDDQNFTVFGEVIGTGMAVVDAIAAVEIGEADRPVEPVVITSIRRMDED